MISCWEEVVGDGERLCPALGDDAAVGKLGGGADLEKPEENIGGGGEVGAVVGRGCDPASEMGVEFFGEGEKAGKCRCLPGPREDAVCEGGDGIERLGDGSAVDEVEGGGRVEKVFEEKLEGGGDLERVVDNISVDIVEDGGHSENVYEEKLEEGGEGENTNSGYNAVLVPLDEGEKGRSGNSGGGNDVSLEKSENAAILDKFGNDANHERLLKENFEGGDGGMVWKDGTYLAAGSLSIEKGEKSSQSSNSNAGFRDCADSNKLKAECILDTPEDAKLQEFLEGKLEVGTGLEYVGVDGDTVGLEKDDGEKGESFEYQQMSIEHAVLENVVNSKKPEKDLDAGGDCGFQAGSELENTVWVEGSAKQFDPSGEYEKEEWSKSKQMQSENMGWDEDANSWNLEVNTEGKWVEGGGDCDNREFAYYETFEKDSPPFNEQDNGGKLAFPQRPGEPDCSYFMRTGKCGYGSNCKFNHPLDRKHYQAELWDMQIPSQAVGKAGKEHPEQVGLMECRFHLLPGGCKYGSACKYGHHGNPKKTETGPVELNFSGLPLRPGQKECPHYIRTGTCKFATNCRFHHPDPTAVTDQDPFSVYENGEFPQQSASGAGQISKMSATLQKSSNELLFSNGSQCRFPAMLFPPQRLHEAPDWDDYQAPINSSHSLEGNIQQFSASVLNDTKLNENNLIPNQTQMQYYPEIPEQSDCLFYIKYGSCKYGSACKFNHPPASTLNCFVREADDTIHQHVQMEEYPHRPGQPECQYFMRHGDCKFKSACKFHHPSALITNGLKTYGDFKQAQIGEYPEKPGECECPHFMRNGWCKFKSACKFHHPSASTLKSPTKADAPVYQKAQMEDHPEKPGEPECSFFVKQGDCKFGSASKSHHLTAPLPIPPLCFTRTISLPLRPDQPICSFYSRFGICKFGPNCKFDHPMDIGSPVPAAAKMSSQGSSTEKIIGQEDKTVCGTTLEPESVW